MAKKKNFSPAMFWAKQFGFAIILIIGAALLISNQNEKAEQKKNAEQKNINSSLSDFYAQHRMSQSKPYEEDKGDFVVDLNKGSESLQTRLNKMAAQQSAPIEGRWVGEHKYRTFSAGSTLRESITNYAQSEGMQVIWELDQDFIVKSQFQMEDTLVGSLYKIAQAVDSNFNGQVTAYVCPKQRSLVITDENTDFLRENCTVARPS
ncbi:toxin co-regulated pilus biosynthesis Q family protein [Planctobacterium marinum]|uniref:toxin co-regulated pilus biosynthesis Q family protein n=1 Tax=Planctobacterium marinum TaxID=1631968 RepID=UPI001E5DDDD1|nr:toxin co-regulated pilus biosynthesis Q family protein [Planctobacterium marinum]MCC2605847.1 toxin co-regulated pilus biosynthesis Q family protein [Planctobacterium marinum]